MSTSKQNGQYLIFVLFQVKFSRQVMDEFSPPLSMTKAKAEDLFSIK